MPGQAFGWAVPALALYLASERRTTAPVAVAPSSLARSGAWLALVAGLVFFFAAVPVLEANPLWPMAQWTGALGAAAVTLAAATLAGGPRFALHFAFPVLFFFTALGWPTGLTVRIVALLSNANAALAAEIVSALGYPAIVSGTVIEVSTGFVGIDEACSGIRSLQAVWMAGWFFGELFQFRWSRRIALAAGSILVALVGNLIRTTTLTWLAAARGLASSEYWHDTAGNCELVGTLLGVALLAWLIARRPRTVAPLPMPAALAGASPAPTSASVLAPPFAAVVVVVVVALAVEGGTRYWYAAHEEAAAATLVSWQLVPPGRGWQPIAVPRRALDLLQSTSAFGLAETDSRTPAYAYAVNWRGDIAHAESAEWHDPTVCLPAGGAQIVATLEPVTITIDGEAVEFAAYRFMADGKPQHIFFAHWDGWLGRSRRTDATQMPNVSAWRLARVSEGHRRASASHLVFVTGLADDEAASAWLATWAPRLLHAQT